MIIFRSCLLFLLFLRQLSTFFSERGEFLIRLYAEMSRIKTKMIQNNGFSVNKEKFTDFGGSLTEDDIIDGKYILAQKGKKDYYIIKING